MKKLSLSLESLEVTTFATVAPNLDRRGTVEGNQVNTVRCDSTLAPANCVCSLWCPTETCPASGLAECSIEIC